MYIDTRFVIIPFGIGCLFWAVVLTIMVITGKEAFVKEGKPRWKAGVLSLALFAFAGFCFWAGFTG